MEILHSHGILTKKKMKHLRFFFILTLLASTFSLFSCKGGEEVKSGDSIKAVLTFKNYKNERGISSSVALTTTDAAVLMDLTSGETLEQVPLSGGSNKGTFIYDIKKAATGDALFFYYPASASPKISAQTAVFNIPSSQNGGSVKPVFTGVGKNSGSTYRGSLIDMYPIHTYVLGTVQKGAYSIKKAVMKSNSSEGIAGDVSVDMTTGKVVSCSEGTITVTYSTPLDCREENANVAFEVAPVTLSKGFTITYYTSGGDEIVYSTDEAVTFSSDEVFRTDPASTGRVLIACGGSKVYIFNEFLARASRNYKDGLMWEWDASSVKSVVGATMDHIDDAKPVNDNKQLLITSSYSWAVLIDIETKELLWYAKGVSGAHSAEILPGNLIAVASATSGMVDLYDATVPNRRLAQYPLTSAHGVVWMQSVERLYAIGSTSLQKYRVMENSLSLDQTYATNNYVTGLHDLTKFDTNTLVMAGSKAAFFNVNTETFTSVPHFSGFRGMKSININSDTGEVYYTFGDTGLSEGAYTWSSFWIRYTDNYATPASGAQSLEIDGLIRVEDINMYKVRVFSW